MCKSALLNFTFGGRFHFRSLQEAKEYAIIKGHILKLACEVFYD